MPLGAGSCENKFMKNNPLFSIVADSADRLFVIDKSRKTVFFPWGSGKQGYYVKNRNLVAKVKKFYKTSYYICLVLLIIAVSFFDKNFWGIVGSMVVCFGSWYFAYFLYVSRIVKSLQPAKVNYTELVLAKYESDESENEELTETKFPAQWSKPIIHQTVSDPFLDIKRIWYRLSPNQLFLLFFFIGGGIIWLWANFNQHEFGEISTDFLVSCFVCILWGLAGFVVAKDMEIETGDWWNFLNWKLPMILIAAIFWILAVASLYKFFVMIIA